jgi:HEAT repeat protein
MADLEALFSDLTSGVEERAQSALSKVKTLGRKPLPGLLNLLQSQDPDIRWWATAALAHIPCREAVQAMLISLSDRELPIRQCAAIGLRLQPHRMAIPALCKTLEDEDRMLARLSGNALITIGSEAVASLTLALRSESAAVRIEAARALAQIDDPAVIPPLFSALEDSSAFVVYFAEEGLSRQGIGLVLFEP